MRWLERRRSPLPLTHCLFWEEEAVGIYMFAHRRETCLSSLAHAHAESLFTQSRRINPKGNLSSPPFPLPDSYLSLLQLEFRLSLHPTRGDVGSQAGRLVVGSPARRCSKHGLWHGFVSL